MAFGRLSSLVGHLRRLVAAPERCGLGDALLLERWLQLRDEAAFEVLLWRHGPLVLGVCRRLLREPQDVEDAFQATFLTLLRKAGSIRRSDSVAAWLYRVAYRIALRAGAARRNDAELLGDDVPAPEGETELLWRDLRPVLDEEVNGLPARYRTAFVLCYLQGKTNAEAAAEIGCPVGTILSRLNWARQRLRKRLERRGLTLTAGLLAVLLVERAIAAPAPASLVQATFQAGLAFAAGEVSGGAVSAKVLTLTQEVIRAMFLAKLKVAAVAAAVTAISLGAGVLAYQSWAGEPRGSEPRAPVPGLPDRGRPQAPASDSPDASQPMYLKVPSQRDGLLLYVATELTPEERAKLAANASDAELAKLGFVRVTETWVYTEWLKGQPESEIIEIDVGKEGAKDFRKFRRVAEGEQVADAAKVECVRQERILRKLKPGDRVKKGDLLGLVDPRVAIDEYQLRKTKVKAAEADHLASQKTRDEAFQRMKTAEKLRERNPTAIPLEEVRGAQLTYDRYFSEEVAKQEAIGSAERELNQGLALLLMTEIRARAAGTIAAIWVRRGEAVKALEAVLQLDVKD